MLDGIIFGVFSINAECLLDVILFLSRVLLYHPVGPMCHGWQPVVQPIGPTSMGHHRKCRGLTRDNQKSGVAVESPSLNEDPIRAAATTHVTRGGER